MRSRSMLAGWVPAAMLLLTVACGGNSPSSQAAATPPPTPTPAPVVVTAMATVAGASMTILTDTKGMTLYYFTPDKGGTITCKAGCLAVWPPLILPSDQTTPVGGPGVTGKLTTAPNPDGKGTQVLYNNWPLYYYAKDTKPGDTTGQNVGAKWFVVPPDLAAG
jgi:predicted lipoprotein with Yx(FWY)xxD motif